jgi:phosphoribosylformylglycinamidine cyclo-ligase
VRRNLSKITYKRAGVDIKKGAAAVDRIKDLVRSTYTKGVITEIGGFGGMFQIDNEAIKSPVLVASTDGVGTKLRVAVMAQKHHTVGEDLVNHCVNDIAVCGAKPLFFLDYFASGKLNSEVFFNVIKGFTKACRENNCALIGGETAEMPDIYQAGDYDLCGTIVGIADRGKIIDGHTITNKSIVIGVTSNGLHTNGYSLARKILFKHYNIDSYIDEIQSTLAEALLQVHLSYLSLINSLKSQVDIQGIAHITGGGIIGNSGRILRNNLKLKIDWNAWPRPPIFTIIKKLGNVPENDMRNTFNLGIGLTLYIDKEYADTAGQIIESNGFKSFVIGQVS